MQAPANIFTWVWLIIQLANILHHLRLQTALGMQPPPPALLRLVRMTQFADATNQPFEVRQVISVENSFGGPGPEHDLWSTSKIAGLGR